jgi:hypothetical protein
MMKRPTENLLPAQGGSDAVEGIRQWLLPVARTLSEPLSEKVKRRCARSRLVN